PREVEGKGDRERTGWIEIRLKNSPVLWIERSQRDLHSVEGAHLLLEVERDREGEITARPLADISCDPASHQEMTAGDDSSSGDHRFLDSHGFEIAQTGPHHDAGGAPALRQKSDCADASD